MNYDKIRPKISEVLFVVPVNLLFNVPGIIRIKLGFYFAINSEYQWLPASFWTV